VATLKEYVERLPFQTTRRYVDKYLVSWANALLERMSGLGVLPPKHLSAIVDVADERWIDPPRLCRDALSLHDPACYSITYPFEEIDGRIRLRVNVPVDALILMYVAAFEPIASLDDEFELVDFVRYDNLIEAWLRWKAEEHEFVASPECEYWRGRVDVELHQLRGEMFNRVNKPVGRRLAGFMQ